MTTKCTGIMGRIFGHNFRHVVTKSEAKLPHGRVEIDHSCLDDFRAQTFHGWVCKRCGLKAGD